MPDGTTVCIKIYFPVFETEKEFGKIGSTMVKLVELLMDRLSFFLGLLFKVVVM